MSQTQIARLSRRGVLAVGGEDAETFLNGLITADAAKVAPGRALYAGLLTPQGKVLFDFIVFSDGGRFLFDVARTNLADFAKRLTFYRLRARVEVDDLSEGRRVIATWGEAAPTLDGAVAPDPRLAALGWRAVVADDDAEPAGLTPASEAEYDAHRIALGVPEGGIDFPFGEPFPHDTDMDQLGGVDFAKGCYVGQEVVSRMEHRGTARRRVVVARGLAPLPAPGTPLTASGRPLGTLGSSAGGEAIALVRLDRAKQAIDGGQPIHAGAATITLALPTWARFGWPNAGGEA